VIVVLRLYQGDGDVRFIVEDVVGELGLAARDQPAADNDPAFGKEDLLANLGQNIPTRSLDGGVMYLVQMSRSLRSFLFIGHKGT
jgi:hypothetical protein